MRIPVFSLTVLPLTVVTIPVVSLAVLALTLPTAAAAQQTTQATPPKHPSPPAHQMPQFWKMARHSVDLLLQPVPQSDAARLAQLKQTFNDLECLAPQLREQPAPDGPNLLCTLPGTGTGPGTGPGPAPEIRTATGLGAGPAPQPDAKPAISPQTILLIAHYEHSGSGESAVDNWTGAILLPFLYHALSYTPRHHTYLLAEVHGESGAKALFDSFTPAERRNILGVVAFDSLGLGPPQFYIDPNDVFPTNIGWWWLNRQLFQAAADQKFPAPLVGIPGSWRKVDDTRPFRHHGIPSILIHSVTSSTHEIPGSASDTSQAINHDQYLSTLTLLDDYITALDQPWPSTVYNPASTPSRGRR